MPAGRPKVNIGTPIKVEITTTTKDRLKRLRGSTVNNKIVSLLNERSIIFQQQEDQDRWHKKGLEKLEVALSDAKARIKFHRIHGKEFGFPFPPWQQDDHTAIGASFCLVTYPNQQLTSIPTASFGLNCGCKRCEGKVGQQQNYLIGECKATLGKDRKPTIRAVSTA
jgi:hypothetical protein